MEQRYWYAICTAKNYEGKVSEKLRKKGYDFYCPHTNVEVKSASRRRMEWKPLFNCCLFVNVNSQELKKVLAINGVVNTLFRGSTPATVSENELVILKQICQPNMSISLQKVPFQELDRASVRVVTDINTDINFISYKYKGLTASLPSLGFKLSAKIQGDTVPVFSEDILQEEKFAA